MCKKVRDLVYSDRRIQVEEIAQALGISHGSVSTILHGRLGMRKLTAAFSLSYTYLHKSVYDKKIFLILLSKELYSLTVSIYCKNKKKKKEKKKKKKKKKKALIQ